VCDHHASATPNQCLISFSVDVRCVFWQPELTVSEPAAFQLHVTCPPHIVISALPIDAITFHLSLPGSPALRIRHIASETEQNLGTRCIRLGEFSLKDGPLEGEANLRWSEGDTVVFSGTFVSDKPQRLQVCHIAARSVRVSLLEFPSQFTKAILTLKEGDWVINVPFANWWVGADTHRQSGATG
jgi:hypothetical protein